MQGKEGRKRKEKESRNGGKEKERIGKVRDQRK